MHCSLQRFHANEASPGLYKDYLIKWVLLPASWEALSHMPLTVLQPLDQDCVSVYGARIALQRQPLFVISWHSSQFAIICKMQQFVQIVLIDQQTQTFLG